MDSFLSYVVRCQLPSYLESKLASGAIPSSQIKSLWSTAVSAYIFSPGLGDAPSCTRTQPSSDIINLLRKYGEEAGMTDEDRGTHVHTRNGLTFPTIRISLAKPLY